MKKSYIVAIGALVLLALFFIVTGFSTASPISDTLKVSVFTNGGTPTGKVLLQVPFIQTLPEGAVLSIAVDSNRDNIHDQSEVLVRNVPAPASADWHAGFYASSATIESGMAAEVMVNGKKYNATAEVTLHEVGALLALDGTTDPENAMKGWGNIPSLINHPTNLPEFRLQNFASASPYTDTLRLPARFSLEIPRGFNVRALIRDGIATAHAQGTKVAKEGVPDIDQQPAECAPTAAANSLIDLVNKNGGEDLVAGDPNDFIENLKRHMNWTPENGVLPPDFVAGKNRWAAAAGVPIRTSLVGDTHGTSTVSAIKAALLRGDAVEIRIKFIEPGGRKVIGGHMVTVIGIEEEEGKTYLYINDPATPGQVTEIIEMNGNELTNYGAYAEGRTLLSWGFVQTWEGHPTGELLDPMTDAEIEGIRQFAGEVPQLNVIAHGGDYIQVSQLRVGNPHPPHETGEGCPEKHWHADGPVTTITGKTVSDPNPGGCGFGQLATTPSINIPAPNRNPQGEGTSGANFEVRGLESLKNN